jgi:hypothetical protein
LMTLLIYVIALQIILKILADLKINDYICEE